MKLNNKGLSLVELIVTVAVMSALVGVLAVATSSQMEKARRSSALENANSIYKMAQIALVESIVENSGSFNYAVKFEATVNGETMYLGRCTNQSVFKYLLEKYYQEYGSNPPGISSSRQTGLSKDNDQYIASRLIGCIPGRASDITSGTLLDKSPIQATPLSSKTVSDHPEQYGDVVFAMAYTDDGTIVFFQCVYKGYFIEISGTQTIAEKVSDSYTFNNWPTQRRTDVPTDGW